MSHISFKNGSLKKIKAERFKREIWLFFGATQITLFDTSIFKSVMFGEKTVYCFMF